MKKILLLLTSLLFVLCSKEPGEQENPEIITYTLNVNTTEGGSVNITEGVFAANTTVVLTATPEEGYTFIGWTGSASGNTNPLNVSMNEIKNITATFARIQYTLTIGIEGQGSVTQEDISASKTSEDYNSGTTIQLSALPEEGWVFNRWSGASTNTLQSINLVMDAAKTITATFEQQIVELINNDLFTGVGRWVIRKPRPNNDKSTECAINEIIFRSNGTFTIISSSATSTGEFNVGSNTTINLTLGSSPFGQITNIVLADSYLSFSINLNNGCTSDVAADKDYEYDEETDPTIPPLLTLIGESTITLNLGDVFTDPGATAIDNIDGDLTSSITASGTVDTTATGTYTIVYSVTDTSGYSSTVTRIIVVTNPTQQLIYFENGTCVCPEANVGDTAIHENVTYTVVDNTSIRTEVNNGNINLCTSLVTNMSNLFQDHETFNDNISFWDTSNVTNMRGMFYNANAFNQDIGSWDTAEVTSMQFMFANAYEFNQDITNWDTANVNDFRYMFASTQNFNQEIGAWNTANVTDMGEMFKGAIAFNQDIGDWNTSSVTNMNELFYGARSFNQNIGSWDTSGVTKMRWMFKDAVDFNHDIGNWDTSSVVNMNNLFSNASSFDQNLNGWNTASVTDMEGLFRYASSFNGNIVDWNTSNVTNMNQMFFNASLFNQDISNWCVSNITSEPVSFAANSALVDENKPEWGSCPAENTSSSIRFENGTCKCPEASVGDTAVIDGVTYTVVDNTSIRTEVALGNVNLCTTQVTSMQSLFSSMNTFNAEIDFWDTSNVTTMASMFSNATAFNQPLNNWNTANVVNMSNMFYKAESFNKPLDSWDVQNVNNMSAMFQDAYIFNQNIDDWNTSNVSNMFSLFRRAVAFNQPLNNWNLEQVTTIERMFYDSYAFNQPLSNWNTSNISNMNNVFTNTQNFNQDISNWDTSNVTSFDEMFDNASAFNQNLSSWCVSKITTTPTNFAGRNALLSTENMPIWGTCPTENTSSSIRFEDGTCKCPEANVGDTAVIDGVTYTVVDNTSIRTEVALGNVNLCTTQVTDLMQLFEGNTTFNMEIGFWDTSNVVRLERLFSGATAFNQDISQWDVSNVTNMVNVFLNATSFNQDIGNWNTGNVNAMDGAFRGASSFNHNLNNWEVSSVVSLHQTFMLASSFNSALSLWDVSNVTDMSSTFEGASSFNQDLRMWNVSNVTTMAQMFSSATSYNQNLSSWNVSKVTVCSNFSQNTSSWTLEKPNFTNCSD